MTKKQTVCAAILLAAVLAGAARGRAAENGSKSATPSVVRYADFGARGDGKTDDLEAIVKAHAFANTHGLPVKANSNATYLIGGKNKTAVIQTNTDFGSAKFIIDDTSVKNRNANVFEIRSALQPIRPKGLSSLKRDQRKTGLTLPHSCVVVVSNSHVKRYIRRGSNRNNGSAQNDVLVVDPKGDVDAKTPIIWDFDRITSIIAYPVDKTPLRVSGGRFTTIANAAEPKYAYYSRGIVIRRSNVLVDGLEHRITGEGDKGAPYGGFINISRCANVTIRNTVLTGHKTYWTIGSAGRRVSMGSYDITLNRAMNVSFVNCRQTNSIHDRTYWGIIGTNYCKNLSFDRCAFSRFDAHQGVVNATIRNSTLGYMGISTIGSGTFLVENTTVSGRRFVNLRQDYGSTWRGEFIIRNCVFKPAPGSACLIGGFNDGQHNFGYTCYMPAKITIEKLRIDDARHPRNYTGPTIFGNFNRRYTNKSYVEKYPYVKTQKVILKDVTTASGKPLRVSDNRFMFRDVVVTRPVGK
jgi:hypothetical protein